MKKQFLPTSILTLTFGLWAFSSSAQICFNASQNFGASYSPSSVINADLNGDGKADLVAANYYDNNISVLLGDGTGSFSSPVNIGGGNNPIAIATADFNADGKADIVTANEGGNDVTLFLGNGAGGFGAPISVAAGSGVRSVTTGDFNADGKKDLAVANNNDNTVSVILGNGNGTFNAAVNYGTSSCPYSVASADFNGDGKADLVTANVCSNNVSVFLGNGNGTFQSAVNYSPNGSGAAFVTAADLNSDSKLDLVVANFYSNSVSVLYGNGNGTFQSGSTYNVGGVTFAATVADFNVDGNLDIAASHMNSSTVPVILGDGNGNFGSAVNFTVGSNPYGIINADFNGDGRADIATANWNDDNISVLLNSNLPLVAANTSATTICPGSSVVLTGTGAGNFVTSVQDITLGNLFNVGSNCGNGSRYGNDPGFNWTSNVPPGSTILSISIQVNVGVDCSGGNHMGYVNGNQIGNKDFGSSYCNCSLRNYIVTYTPATSFYNIGGSNSFQMIGNTFGMCPNTGWPGGVYARVIVNYTKAGIPDNNYSWTGGVGPTNGVPFNPPSTATYTVTGTTIGGCTNTAPITITVLPSISNSINTQDASCTCNGTADVTASGGTGALSYLWSTGNTTTAISALCAGTYTLTTTDAQGCKEISTTTINSNPAMSFSQANPTTHATCVCNGTADIAISGGTAPYSYSWSNGATTSAITGLCPGTYTLTATDSYSVACSNVTTVTILSTPSMAFSITKVNASCTGTVSCNGSAAATVTGGDGGPYTYAWAPSGGTTSAATGLCAGTYTLTATDGLGCINKATTVIGVTPMSLSFVNISANCSSSCTGKSTVTATGGSGPYTYSWSSSAGTNATATGLCGGSSYTVTVTDATGCSKVAVTTISSNPLVTINSFNTNDASCADVCNGSASANISAGVMPYTYAWAPSAGTNATATGLCESTTYTLTVSDANGCTSTATVSVGDNGNYPNINNFSTNGSSCDAVCNGSATVAANGGTGSLSYAWAPSGGSSATATGLCAQTEYTLTVTDAIGCKNMDYVTVGTNMININLNAYDASCIGVCNGTADATVSNTSGSYSYLWTGGATTSSITGLCSGSTYTLTVTEANGCVTSGTFNIYADNSFYVDLDHGWWDRATCLQSCDGIVYSDPNNGYAPYTYLWSNGATTQDASNLCSGVTVMLTVTDSIGCKAQSSILVEDRDDGVYVDWVSTNDTWCNGICSGDATAFLDNDNNTPIQYIWSSGSTTFQTTGLCVGTHTITVTDSLNCTDTYEFDIYSNSSVSFDMSYNDASCEQICNGNAMVYNVQGAVSPVSYLWMPSGQTTATATGLCAGTEYTVTVTDANGCTEMDTRTIGYDYDLSWDLYTDVTNASCVGICNGKDSVYVNVNWSNAQNSPYLYQWFPSGGTNALASGLCPGDYTVTVTDSVGCKGYISDNISSGSAPSISMNSTNVYCNNACNGTAIATVTGGTAPYMYAWTNGATTASVSNLCAGTYGLSVTDANGCVSTTQVTIYATSSGISVSVSSVSPLCNGAANGTASASVSGGVAPYMYQWLPSGGSSAAASALAAGTYTVIVTDANGCSQSKVTTLTQPASLVTNVTVTNSISCVEGDGTATANVAGGTAPYSFVWTPTGQITQTAVVLANGTYSVVVTDANGCTATGSNVISCTSGIDELAAANVFTVSPNPTMGNLVVTAATGVSMDEISIDNVLGQTVFTTLNSKHQSAIRIDITAQPAGIYFMSVKADGNVYTQKLIKQ